MKKTVVFLLFTFFCSWGLSAQNDDLLKQNFMFDTRMGFSSLSIPTAVTGPRSDPGGSAFHFLQDDWEEAVILSRENERAEAEARYDIRWDQVILRHEGQMVQLLPEKTRAVVIGTALLVPQLLDPEDGSFARLGWFELLSNGGLQLLKRYRLDKRSRDVQPGMLNQEGNFKWVVVDELFVRAENEPARVFRPNKKRVLELFGRKGAVVERFAEEKGLGYKKENDLKAIFHHYNSLLEDEQEAIKQ